MSDCMGNQAKYDRDCTNMFHILLQEMCWEICMLYVSSDELNQVSLKSID